MPRWEKFPRVNFLRAREMRREPTTAEKKLWQSIRADKLGTRARRQMTIGPFIADFVLPEVGLIFELDGSSHVKEQQIERDKLRTLWFEAQGYEVVRIWNHEVLRNVEGVVASILRLIAETPLTPPLKRGGIRRCSQKRAGNQVSA